MKRLLLAILPCLLSAQVAPEAARIQTFQSTAKVVRRGDTVTLRWAATGTGQVRLDPLGLILPAKGEITHTVTGRITYWLHVSNSTGGQSVPLVVDLVPETTAPVLPAVPLPVMPAELPKLAALPQTALPQPPALPSAAPAIPTRRVARRHGGRRAWIQFAATVSVKGANRMQRNLQRVAALDSTLLVRNRRAGRPYQLIRYGPFPSAQAAAHRLQELAPSMRALNIKPIVILGPPQPTNPAPTFIANTRQPS
jgi:hypothetical protein